MRKIAATCGEMQLLPLRTVLLELRFTGVDPAASATAKNCVCSTKCTNIVPSVILLKIPNHWSHTSTTPFTFMFLSQPARSDTRQISCPLNITPTRIAVDLLHLRCLSCITKNKRVVITQTLIFIKGTSLISMKTSNIVGLSTLKPKKERLQNAESPAHAFFDQHGGCPPCPGRSASFWRMHTLSRKINAGIVPNICIPSRAGGAPSLAPPFQTRDTLAQLSDGSRGGFPPPVQKRHTILGVVHGTVPLLQDLDAVQAILKVLIHDRDTILSHRHGLGQQFPHVRRCAAALAQMCFAPKRLIVDCCLE